MMYMNFKPTVKENNNLSEFTAKKALPPTAVLPVMAPVRFRHSHWAAVPFRLQSASTILKISPISHAILLTKKANETSIGVKGFRAIYTGKAKDRVLVVLLSDRIEMLPE